MSDNELIERLLTNSLQRSFPDCEESMTMSEAAVALRRLTADNARLMAVANEKVAECEGLREALAKIAKGKRVDWNSVDFSYEPLDAAEARLIARTALAQKDYRNG